MLKKFEVYRVAKEVHWVCKELKISRFLRDQLDRASSSIVLNIAEGSGKRTPQDQKKFYTIALGSLRECEAILDLEKVEDRELLKNVDRLGAMLYVLSHHGPNPNRSENQNGTETETETETITVR